MNLIVYRLKAAFEPITFDRQLFSYLTSLNGGYTKREACLRNCPT